MTHDELAHDLALHLSRADASPGYITWENIEFQGGVYETARLA